MRKDLKIGLAIGAVLLVVLIVYMAVPKSDNAGTQDGATLAQGDDAAGGEADPQAADAGAAPADEGAARTEVARADGADGAGAAPPQDPFDRDARPADATPSEPGAERASGKETNWAKLLESGELPFHSETPPSLSASTTTGGGATPADEAAPAAAKVSDGSAAEASAADASTASQDAAPAPTSVTPPETTEAARRTTIAREGPKPTTGPAAGGARTHKIERGETFSSIAKALYGSDRHYLAIQDANPDIDPTRLKPGMVIKLPDPASIKATRSSGSPDDRAVTAGGRQERELDPAREYRVKPNDNLHDIAKRIYHAANMSDEIYELNKETIGSDPSRLKVGMILKLPAKPTTELQAPAR